MNTLLKRFQAIKKIRLHGKRWWPIYDGGSWANKPSLPCYSSVEIYVNDYLIHKINNHFGYEDEYQMVALNWLNDNKYIEYKGPRDLWVWKPGDIKYTVEIEEVQRKKDL